MEAVITALNSLDDMAGFRVSTILVFILMACLLTALAVTIARLVSSDTAPEPVRERDPNRPPGHFEQDFQRYLREDD